MKESIEPAAPYTLEGLDTWEAPRSLRLYQRLIAQGHPFELAHGGRVFRYCWCTAEGGRNLIDLVDLGSGDSVRLASDFCGKGYRLSGQKLQPLERVHSGSAGELPAGRAMLRIGHRNFAHFLWNQLDALLQLARGGAGHGVVQDHVTVLDLAVLEAVKVHGRAALASRPSVYPGAMVVTPDARRLVLADLGVPMEPPSPAEKGTGPTLLVGVRGPGKRELVGEVALLCGLINALGQAFPSATILLDGFTFQRNNLRDPGALRRETLVRERIQEILAGCDHGGLEVISGLGIGEALRKIRHVDWYVTHAGTMQHKIGWFFPWIPGVCLRSPQHSRAAARWHQDQCQGAVPIEALPPTLLADAEGMEPVAERGPQRNRPFRITDSEGAIVHLVEACRGHLPTQQEP